MSRKKTKEKKKEKENPILAEINRIFEESCKAMMQQAFDEIFGGIK